MKPKILLSGNTNLHYYVDAVRAAGGEAHARYCPPLSLDYDALLLCGGNDIDPARYGRPLAGSRSLDLERDASEMRLFSAYFEAGKPIFGVCRGMQLVNVALGGTLCQDIESTPVHLSGEDFYAAHPITSEEGCVLDRLYGRRFSVNSSHHQAVEQPGAGLRITARSEEGVIEALEHESRPVLAVQFHPERMCESEAREDTVDGLPLFRYFLSLIGRGTFR